MDVLIVSGGTEPSKELLLKYKNKASFIIGVDKGCNVLYKYNITPNLIVGDFDSGDLKVVEYFKNTGIEVRKYSTHKDYTDTHLAYNIAKELGDVKKIYLLGATGTRFDHSLGNLGLFLNSLEDEIYLEIVDDNNIMFIVDKKTTIKNRKNKVLSFHGLSDEVKNFTIKNAKYELERYNLKLLEPRAICNEFLDGEDVQIDFDSGKILVMLTND
ncbi:thiamine pyrophosphokinase [Clostridium thermobutyricum]|uniref:Thiamine diphosphokinase n=1 Tax=Clostridium thermobutyricum TaxID=29372 RepID=N9Y0T8_9CLOT|nr:thiamine diphosphokinase [Clostridium thermobutyricum]ENZ01744.1 thiamine pyrophosphokinase [Clostridium thermobutyricum]